MEGITKRVGRHAGRVLQIEGWRAGGSEGGREGGMENITNEIIETVISATGVYIYDVMT